MPGPISNTVVASSPRLSVPVMTVFPCGWVSTVKLAVQLPSISVVVAVIAKDIPKSTVIGFISLYPAPLIVIYVPTGPLSGLSPIILALIINIVVAKTPA